MSTSEIAKLESRWRENPQGLTFAPLAEAYRKMKEPQRALEILAEGLASHADYIPASIVLGRCHLDLADDTAAEQAFVHVLALDGENVIALKALADITERHLRFDEAGRWLSQLLTIDRSNDEARTQLARVEAARVNAAGLDSGALSGAADEPASDALAEAAATDAEISASGWSAPEPAVPEPAVPESSAPEASVPEPSPWEPVSWEPLHAESPASDSAVIEPAVTEPAAREPAADESDESLDDLMAAEPASYHAAPPDPDLILRDIPAFDDGDTTPSPLDGLESQEFARAEDEPIAPALGFEPDDAGIHADEELDLRSSGASEFQVGSASDELAIGSFDSASSSMYHAPDAAADLAGSYDFATPDADSDAASTEELVEEPAPSPAPAWSEPVAEAEWRHDADPAEPDDEPEADAEPDRPSDSGSEPAVAAEDAEPGLVMTESMAELYLRQGHRLDALRIYRELYLRHPEDFRLREKVDELETTEAAAESGELEPTAYGASSTGGQAVSALFGRILSARPAAVPLATRAPAHPAAARGIESSTSGEPTRPADDRLSLNAIFGDDTSPVPPAVPTQSGSSGDGMSFDDFFDAPAAREPVTRRPAARGDDDLDQFHAWLQNLKR